MTMEAQPLAAIPAPEANASADKAPGVDREVPTGYIVTKAVNGVKTLESVGDLVAVQPLMAAVGGVQSLGRPAELAPDQLPMSQAVGDLNSAFKAPMRVDSGFSINGNGPAGVLGSAVSLASGSADGIGPMRATLDRGLDAVVAGPFGPVGPSGPFGPIGSAGPFGPLASLDRSTVPANGTAEEQMLAALETATPLPQQLLAAGLRREAEMDALARALMG